MSVLYTKTTPPPRRGKRRAPGPPEGAKAEPRAHRLWPPTRCSFLWNSPTTAHQSEGSWLTSWGFNMQSNEPQMMHVVLRGDRQIDGRIETQREQRQRHSSTQWRSSAQSANGGGQKKQSLTPLSFTSALYPLSAPVAVKFEFSCAWMVLPLCHHTIPILHRLHL